MKWTPERIKQLRKRLGLTQQKFADKLGYARRETVAELESGKFAPNKQAQILLDMIERETL